MNLPPGSLLHLSVLRLLLTAMIAEITADSAVHGHAALRRWAARFAGAVYVGLPFRVHRAQEGVLQPRASLLVLLFLHSNPR
jgi:hypothetical protein